MTPSINRIRMPAASVSPSTVIAASVPIRRASGGPIGEPTAMQITGAVVRTPAAVVDSGTLARISSSSGGTLAIAVRRLSAVNTIAAAIRPSCRGYALARKRNSLNYCQEGTAWPRVELDPQQLLIGGEWVPASSRPRMGRAPARSRAWAPRPSPPPAPEDVQRAADAAQAAFPAWSNTPPGERRALLSRAADLLQERAEQIAAIVTEETGGTFGWGMFNCGLAAGMLREAAAQAYGLIGEVIPSDVPGLLALGVRQPVGVIAGIAPWNAPVILGTRAIATPLAYGNTVDPQGVRGVPAHARGDRRRGQGRRACPPAS